MKTFVADWDNNKAQLQWLRQTVFVEEQGVSREDEWDEHDVSAIHFLTLNSDGEPIATGRLLPSGQFGRMAVLQSQRGHGIGAQLLQFVLQWAEASHYPRLFLHAQSSAIGFYEKHGFVITSEPYEEAGIIHQNMEHRGGPSKR